MRNFPQKLTIYYVFGIVLTIIGIIGLILFVSSSGMNDQMTGMYASMLLIPALIIIVIDRICVQKFGTKKVNKSSLYILAGLFLLYILNTIRLVLVG
ncbi:hypothetical protein [Paenimyroides aestuarii]|uniref:Uncharacterized protein n=1 Tax=Paenimyroides aestuarii TaxID=2968490 RepID=A0ABY5NVF2_9FLAO|nr:hypothetical protein [Paenimyroides aestuarii]UUV22567.1 hypothetical protein NPX36_05870 [Paenimyroides aestuarii]